MRKIRGILVKTLATTAFTCLMIGGSAGLGRADSGLDTGAGGLGYQQNTESIEHSTGSGAGGSTDTGTSTDSNTYRGTTNSNGYINHDNFGYDSSSGSSGSGSGAGGATDQGTSGTGNYNTPSGNYNQQTPGYRNHDNPCYGNDQRSGTSTGSGAGGYVTGTGTGAETGEYSTETEMDTRDSFTHGTTIGGVTYPDHSESLGPSGQDYWSK